MPFHIIHEDITKMKVDAIVNSAHPSPIVGGGVDFAIHRVAGSELLFERQKHGDIATGAAIITQGYQLPAKYVIHTVGPVWRGGARQEEEYLKRSYVSCLNLALEHNIESVAFPLISGGIYGYPLDQAIKIAMQVIKKFLEKHDMMIYLVLFDKRLTLISDKREQQITRHLSSIKDNKILTDDQRSYSLHRCMKDDTTVEMEHFSKSLIQQREVSKLNINLDKTFSESLLQLITEKGIKDSDAYKKSNIDRKLFSKIRSQKDYKPTKNTVFAFSIGLKLNLDETKDLLLKAGFAISPSHSFDQIIQYCIDHRIYNIYEVNTVLYSFKQPLLGSGAISL